ncbi:phosphinothricin acetyltransferase [Roseovarius halotolerans]|uniref:N-acyltransferase YncA n=1 Tax=Roseovarius halotolerans TaxID=505353 RepID=A0A1X6ZDT5_9RHOB|nr:GNAT family N-acetyltransferase [Roseovarius halotolerans]RKT30745.1 phosphinothricin acetyltransferase [Roseovarius halotolerans]SLN48959.1 N-acyltransferase YncA [Roseovarius halotolerans]
MITRAAQADDAPAIAALWNPVIRDTAITFNSQEKSAADIAADIAARRAAGHEFLLAEEDGRLLGFAAYGQFRGGPGYARTGEHTIILGDGARGRGVGRALLGAIEDHARGAKMHTMFAGVSGENPSAVAFHERLGYLRIAVLAQVGWKFGRWMDLVLLQKRL